MDYSENTKSLARFQALLPLLSEEDLCQTLSNGWTVSMTFTHLAFWDRYALSLIEHWEKEGIVPRFSNFEAMNDGLEFVTASVPHELTYGLALDAMTALDQKIATLPETLVNTMRESGFERLLFRNLHRNGHIEQIETELGLKER